MDRFLRILIVEDIEADIHLLLRELQKGGYRVEYEHVETAAALEAALRDRTWDLILCDYSLPGFDAPRALQLLQATGKDIPFIILSGTIGEETAVASLKAGAHDFLIKGKYARLIPAIERELREAESRRARHQAEAKLREKERLLSESQRVGRIGSWGYDIASDAMHVSDEVYRLFDVAPEEFNHNLEGWLSLLYPSDRPPMTQWLDEIKLGRRLKELEFRIFRKNGELRYLQARAAADFDASGKAARLLGTVQDVTDHKLAEIQIRQQVAQLTALRKIDQAITSTSELRVALNTVLVQTLEQLQVDAADILTLRPDQHTLEFAAGRGFHTVPDKSAHIRIGESFAGRVAQERRILQRDVRDEPAADAALAQFMAAEGFVSYFGVPLITKGKVNGVLEVFHRSPLQPYPEWLEFLETLAGQAAIAIENATLFENLQRSNLELKIAYDATIEGWSHALDLRDKETEGHTRRVTEMTLHLARLLKVSEEQLVHIRRGGLLHDIGKMGVPDSILLKESQLTEAEWEIMRRHPQLAYDWLAPIAFLEPALEIPYCHHEKWDGSGYPRGLSGEQIPLSARIFAVADVWDALTNDRPYRKRWTHEQAVHYIRGQSGKHFDPQVTETFLTHIAPSSPD